MANGIDLRHANDGIKGVTVTLLAQSSGFPFANRACDLAGFVTDGTRCTSRPVTMHTLLVLVVWPLNILAAGACRAGFAAPAMATRAGFLSFSGTSLTDKLPFCSARSAWLVDNEVFMQEGQFDFDVAER